LSDSAEVFGNKAGVFEINTGVLEDECRQLMQQFFKDKRKS